MDVVAGRQRLVQHVAGDGPDAFGEAAAGDGTLRDSIDGRLLEHRRREVGKARGEGAGVDARNRRRCRAAAAVASRAPGERLRRGDSRGNPSPP